jgi:hypothetical protein
MALVTDSYVLWFSFLKHHENKSLFAVIREQEPTNVFEIFV